MAERRMFAKSVIDCDDFLDLSHEAQLLYFHLGMQADDDGFVKNPRSQARMLGLSKAILEELINGKFLIQFESGVVAIAHWKISNLIRKDRYHSSVYTEEKKKLHIKENGEYTLDKQYSQNLNMWLTEDSIGKSSTGEDSLVQGSEVQASLVQVSESEESSAQNKTDKHNSIQESEVQSNEVQESQVQSISVEASRIQSKIVETSINKSSLAEKRTNKDSLIENSEVQPNEVEESSVQDKTDQTSSIHESEAEPSEVHLSEEQLRADKLSALLEIEQKNKEEIERAKRFIDTHFPKQKPQEQTLSQQDIDELTTYFPRKF